MIAFLCAVFATGLVCAAVFAYLVTRPRLSVFVEDPPPDEDEMDAYLQQRAEGKGVLPPEVFRPHTACFNALCDREPSKICLDCMPLLESVKPVVGR